MVLNRSEENNLLVEHSFGRPSEHQNVRRSHMTSPNSKMAALFLAISAGF